MRAVSPKRISKSKVTRSRIVGDMRRPARSCYWMEKVPFLPPRGEHVVEGRRRSLVIDARSSMTAAQS